MKKISENNLDGFDFAILELLQDDCRQTADQISKKVALSPAAVQKRLKKLRSGNLIIKEAAIIDRSRIGYQITAIIEIQMERENSVVMDAFCNQMRRAPNVQQCYYTTGETDFFLVLLSKDIKEYELFTKEHLFDNPAVKRFTTSIVTDIAKIGLEVPLEYE